MFQIKKPTASSKSVRLPDTLIEKLNNLSNAYDISFNQVVVQCCEYAIERLEKTENPEQLPQNK